ncbi:MAG: hypothetical protein Q9222_004256 [Ikaeria aurantiellina]
MADALCGPSNSLQNFQKHTSVDRTLQQDRFTSRRSPIPGFRTPNPNAALVDAQFEAFLAGESIVADAPQPTWDAYNAAPVRSHLPQQPGSDWASDFQNLQVHDERATPVPSTLFRQEAPMQHGSSGPWQREYSQYNTTPINQYHQTSSGNVIHHPHFSSYTGQPSMSATAPQTQAETADIFDEAAFSKAFETARSELQDQEASMEQIDVLDHAQPTDTLNQSVQESTYRIGSDRITDESEQRREPLSHEQEADELARTAGQLLENVKHDQSIKFQESNFLSLMRQLRDREVKVEGDKFVEAKQPLHPGGPGYPDSIHHQNVEKDINQPRPAPNKVRASSVPRHRSKGQDPGRTWSIYEVITANQVTTITLTETRDSSDGSSVSGKHSFRTSILPCGDQDDCALETGPNPLSTAPSNEPPPFSAHNFSSGISPTRAPSPITEPDYPPPPPFAPAQLDRQQPSSASEVGVETKAALAAKKEGESSKKSAEENEPPPPYTEGSSPLGSFTYVMAAAGGPASIITQVSPGGPPPPPGGHSFAVAQTIPSTSPSPVTDTPSAETAAPGSAREMLQDRVGIIVLREDLDFYAIPPRAEIDQSEMIEVKRAAGRALLRQDGIFSGLRKSEEAGTTEQHLIEMLTAGYLSPFILPT